MRTRTLLWMAPLTLLASLAVPYVVGPAWAQAKPDAKAGVKADLKPTGYADGLYILDGGVGRTRNAGAWLNSMLPPGTPFEVSVYAHLIKHGDTWMLFDTSTSDFIATLPNGLDADPKHIRWIKSPGQTMTAQLKLAGITPADVKLVGISHYHPDHVGNVSLFKNSTVLIQKLEYDPMMANGGTPHGPPAQVEEVFERNHPVSLLDGDYDVFGDGSVILFWVGGHTTGSQVCLVRLRNTGYVLLSGDAVHLRNNFDTRRIPRFELADDKNQWLTTVPIAYERVAALMSFYHAQMWVLHDQDDYKSRKMAPQYYD